MAKLAACPKLRRIVEAKLALRWSPQQIADWLSAEFPDDAEMHVSHETIYMSLFVPRAAAPCARSCFAACARAGPPAGREVLAR